MTRALKLLLFMLCAPLYMAPTQPASAQDEFSNNTRGGLGECRRQDERDGWECTGDPYAPYQGRMTWCHMTPGFQPPEGPDNHPVTCLPPGELPPYLQGGGGAAPEGPYLGRRPPTGQIPRRGPGAYPPDRVTCQYYRQLTPAEQKRIDVNPYGCDTGESPFPANQGTSPYGSGDQPQTPQPGAAKPLPPKYPWIVGRPGWIAADRREPGIRAYRFNNGHVYEWPKLLAGGGNLLLNPAPRIVPVTGNQVQYLATYMTRQGPLAFMGRPIE